jgi:hypothetical protein
VKKVLLAILILGAFSAWSETCHIRIEREGMASRDLLHQGQVMMSKGAQFIFIKNIKEEVSLDECIKLANDEGARLTNHESITKAKSKLVIQHPSLVESPLELEVVQSH